MDEVRKRHDIYPRKGVDSVDFGIDVGKLESLGYCQRLEKPDEVIGWRTFVRDGAVVCYVEEGVVVTIACFANCHLDGKNLIGLTIAQIVSMFGVPDEIGEALWVSDDEQQTPYEYEAKGLQIWFEGGAVVSVFCNNLE